MVTYLLSGASRGLGLELAAQLLSRPVTSVKLVFATARNMPSPALQALIDNSAGRLVHILLDPVNINSVQTALPNVQDLLAGAPLDVIINNVGAMPYSPNGIRTMNDLTSTFEVNVLSAHNVTSVFLPLVEASKQKKIVNISTTLGSNTMAPRFSLFPVPAYKISKAALNMLTVQYALEYAEKGFVFFSISPGWVKTDLGGEAADLTVEQSVAALLSAVHSAGKESNGKFYNVLVKGWEENPGLNQYPGGEVPW